MPRGSVLTIAREVRMLGFLQALGPWHIAILVLILLVVGIPLAALIRVSWRYLMKK